MKPTLPLLTAAGLLLTVFSCQPVGQVDPDSTKDVPVTGIRLDKESLELIEGETFTITATVEPEDATDKTVVWQSSDESIVAIEDGVVTAVAIGEATLTASAPYNGLSASCEVTVSRNLDRNIVFADKNLEAVLVAAFDANEDGGLSYREAAEVSSLEGVFGDRKDFKSFDEFQYFTGLTSVSYKLFMEWMISSIVLPNSIVNIESCSFLRCESLQKVIFPEGLIEIGSDAFDGCICLESIDLPSTLQIIRNHAFFECKSLRSVIFPESLQIIGGHSFAYTNLTSIEIPVSVKTIEDGAFSSISSLKEFKGAYASDDGRMLIDKGTLKAFAPAGLTHYSIPDGIEIIGRNVFSDCTNLLSVNIPEGVQKIISYAFSHCGLSTISFPESITSIGRGSFGWCQNISSVCIPQNVDNLDVAFFECANIQSFSGKYAADNGRLLVKDKVLLAFAPKDVREYTIPEGIEEIGAATFQNCKGLRFLSIPKSVTRIQNSAFWGCSSLESLSVLPTTPPSGNEYMFYATSCPIYVPTQAEKAYKQADYWREYADRINPPYGPAVDLGLSVKWATYNIGAKSITDTGGYFAWGELGTDWYYDGAHYALGSYNNGILNINYYNKQDGWTTLFLGDDVAYVSWGDHFNGASWRMPTQREYAELINHCNWEWYYINNVKGIRLTSRINGNSIFFPAAGLIEGNTNYYRGSAIYYWASTKPSMDDYQAHCFASMNESLWVMNKNRTLGMPVRAVKNW